MCNPGCPKDMIIETLKPEVQVSWNRTVCTDNSKLPPDISTTRKNGGTFASPGAYEIEVTAEDYATPKNKYNCTFRLTLKSECLLLMHVF